MHIYIYFTTKPNLTEAKLKKEMSQHSGVGPSNAIGISPMMSSPQQPQSQQSQGSASSTGSLSILPTTPHSAQQSKSSESMDSIAKVKSLVGPLRESLAVIKYKYIYIFF